jgi:hypothetical protein
MKQSGPEAVRAADRVARGDAPERWRAGRGNGVFMIVKTWLVMSKRSLRDREARRPGLV